MVDAGWRGVGGAGLAKRAAARILGVGGARGSLFERDGLADIEGFFGWIIRGGHTERQQ